MASPVRPEKQYNPDAEFGRAYLIGCAVLIVLFVLGTALIAYIWLHSGP